MKFLLLMMTISILILTKVSDVHALEINYESTKAYKFPAGTIVKIPGSPEFVLQKTMYAFVPNGMRHISSNEKLVPYLYRTIARLTNEIYQINKQVHYMEKYGGRSGWAKAEDIISKLFFYGMGTYFLVKTK